MFGDVSMLDGMEVAIDEKGRIYLPSFTHSEAREELFFIKKQNYVEVWSSAKIIERVKKLNDLAFNETDIVKRNKYQSMSDELTAFLKKCHVEKDGKRIALGKEIVAEYHLSKSIRIEGKEDHIRLWEPSKFLEYQEALNVSRNK